MRDENRMTTFCIIFGVVVVASLALDDASIIDAVVPEMSIENDPIEATNIVMVRPLKDDFAPGTALTQARSEELKHVDAVLLHIQDLRAYCVAARPKAITMREGTESMKTSAFVALIDRFGAPLNPGSNLVVTFAQLMGELMKEFPKVSVRISARADCEPW